MPETNSETMIFDRRALRRNRDRAAAGFDGRHDFLVQEIGDRLLDRLEDIRRRFPVALDLGGHTGALARLCGGRGGIETLITADLSPAMIARAPGPRLVADEEWLPFADNSLDLVLSCLSLHWVNDLPGALIQANRALKPDGLFLAAILGGETLQELKASLAAAEIAETGTLVPRASPTVDIRDAGRLLQRAGFALPVVDSDVLTVSYPDALALMRDLRQMGEANALAARPRRPWRRATLARAAADYADRFGTPDGRVEAKFEVIFLTGWAPDASQPRPLRPGSAKSRLAAALGSVEKKL
ncbi:methyltransferase domain-containing protein [Elstera cyanobacteriorum]|uniref:methyltransferase domain-containing protein n=1 Tax=Elstera cyanobacteriorum TaxID=2022747 RepID=UPI0023530DB0|nr:methyltransferase domain-containing protein [Elstera cyanobacteriorum]MCK6441506.1 methyltransferase domain-containing protein [Elstera cyanobacteriorum]